MSKYRVEYELMVHEGRTKDYEIISITDMISRKCLLIRRWGAVGKSHQEKMMQFGRTQSLVAYARKTKEDKLAPSRNGKHGYKMQASEGYSRTSLNHEQVTTMLIDHGVKVGNSEYVAFMGMRDQVTSDVADVAATAVIAQREDLPEHYGTW